MYENNVVRINGEALTDFIYSHENNGESFYLFNLRIGRRSGIDDIIPVIVSEKIINVNENCKGKYLEVAGQFRSHNKKDKENVRLILAVFAFDVSVVEFLTESDENNLITIDGYICKKPIYRVTPNKREIADVLIAINRSYGKSDYIPCIFWGRNARFLNKLDIGTRLNLKGRIQSRDYVKRYNDGSEEVKTAYEVSVNWLEVVSDEE